MKRVVEFYVLWKDKTWTVEAVTLRGEEAECDADGCINIARETLTANGSHIPGVELVGPPYSLGPREGKTDAEEFGERVATMDQDLVADALTRIAKAWATEDHEAVHEILQDSGLTIVGEDCDEVA